MRRLLLLMLVAACAPDPPRPERRCVASHEWVQLDPVPTGGIPMGGIPVAQNLEMVPRPHSACDTTALFHANGREFARSRRAVR